MHQLIQQIRLPDGTVFQCKDPFPDTESGGMPFVITDITIAPKTSEDVSDTDNTNIEELPPSIEIWAGVIDQRFVPEYKKAGWTFCLRVYLGELFGTRALEIWSQEEVQETLEDRRNIGGDEDEPPANGGTAVTQQTASES